MALEFSWYLPLAAGSPPASTPGQWIQLAQAVEYAGLDALWIPADSRTVDSLGVAAALCAHTRQLRLHVGVPPQVMLPAALAATLQSLQSISGQRISVHLPDGERGSLHSAFGEWLNRDQRNERVGEFLHLLTRLLAPGAAPLDHQGRYFQLEQGGLGLRPLPAPPLILDASQSSELIAEHAQVCQLAGAHPDELAREVQRLRALQPALRFALPLGLILRDSEAQAWDAAGQSAQASDAGTQPMADRQVRPLFAEHATLRRDEIHPQLWRPYRDRPLTLVGDPPQVAARLQQLHDLGIDQVIIHGEPAVAEVLRFAEQVLPLLRARGLHHKAAHHER